jgi:hypothetical protein
MRKRLAVDTERAAAVVVLDPVVVPDRQQTLAHPIARADGRFVTTVSQKSHQTLPSMVAAPWASASVLLIPHPPADRPRRQ